MTYRKKIVFFWLAFVVVLVVALGAVQLTHRWHHIFPTEEVSEAFKRYVDDESVAVSFVKGYRVNDTLMVDVTLVEAKDTAAWERICGDFHITSINMLPEELRELFLEGNAFGYTTEEGEKGTERRITVNVYSRKNMTVCVFHELDEGGYDALLDVKMEELEEE